MTLAKEIALTHHEKWDGTGYPRGLSQTEIPIAFIKREVEFIKIMDRYKDYSN